VAIDFPVEDWAAEEGIADEEILARVEDAAAKLYASKREQYGAEIMGLVEKEILLRSLDNLWRDHLLTLEHLRQAVGLRGYGQRDPLNEYKTEAFTLFEALLQRLREWSRASSCASRSAAARPSTGCPRKTSCRRCRPTTSTRSPGATMRPKRRWRWAGPSSARPGLGGMGLSNGPARDARPPVKPDDPTTWGKVGRNETCPCGSGKKFKHCHGALV
jgi:preprotein translocase subunit SecA